MHEQRDIGAELDTYYVISEKKKDLGLLYQSKLNASLIGYEDGRYLSDPQKAESGYLFTYAGTAIS